MRAARKWLRRASAAALAALAAGCGSKDGSPTAPRQANLAIQAQVSGADGASLRVHIYYQRTPQQSTGGSLETVTLFDRTMPFATGTTTMPVVLDVSGCIADKRRVPLTSGCEVAVDLSLVSGTTVLDEQTLEGVGLAPGQTTQLPNVVLTPVHSIVVAPAVDTIVVGQTVQLSDTVKDVTGQVLTGRTIVWSTSDPTIAAVNASGLVTAVAASTTPVTISATTAAHSGSATIVVQSQPTMTLSADTIRFGATRNAAVPPSQTVTVMNSGGGTLQGLSVAPVAYHGTSSGWLQATLVDSTVTLTILTTNLPASTDTALVIISSTNASNSPVAILVLYQIGQGAVLQLSPDTLAFNVSLGTTPATQSTTVTNVGGGSLGTISTGTVQWGVGAPPGWGTTPTGWLSASVSGTSVTVTITNTAVPLGGQFTTAIVPVKSSGAADSVNLVVHLNVSTQFTQVTVGRDHACALTKTKLAYCWGDNSQHRQLGDGTTSSAWPVPVPVAGAHTFASLSAGYYHTCGILADSTAVYCWGANGSGQLGDGTTADRNVPVLAQIPSIYSSSIGQLAAGGATTCVNASIDFITYCWGANDHDQVDPSAQSPQLTPYQITTPTTFTQISAGRNHFCGVDPANHLWCWGDNTYLQLAQSPASSAVPLTVNSVVALDTTATSSFAGPASNTSCVAETASEHVQCWGDNTSGNVGNLAAVGGSVSTPATVVLNTGAYLSSAVQVSTGTFHSCAATSTGTAYCWGDNSSGELGTGGGNTNYAAPVTGGPSGFASVFASYYWTCGMGTDGRVYCWGGNTFGRLGLGSTSSSTTPAVVKGQQ